LKSDNAHFQYNQRIIGNVMNREPVPQQQPAPVPQPQPEPVQQQPIEKQLTNEDVKKMIQRAQEEKQLAELKKQREQLDEPPKQQPVPQPVQPENESQKMLDQLKQDEIDKKADDELFEVLSEQLDGWPVNDARVRASAPEHLRDRLRKAHYDLL
ncbi:unnamed protein product, partial [marine sediment metagenome]